MNIVGVIIGLVLGAIAYFVAGLFLPYIIAVLIGVAVFLPPYKRLPPPKT